MLSAETHRENRDAIREGSYGRFLYNYFRYYDPTIGRYVSADPIGQQGGPNVYGYAFNSPIVWGDPHGLDTWGFGWTSTAGAGGGVTATTSVSVDSSGDVSTVTTAGAGGYGGVGASTGPTFTYTTADSNADLSGGGGQVGGSVGEGASVGAEYVTGKQGNGSLYHGVDVNVGVSAGLAPAEAHGFATNTQVESLGNLGDWLGYALDWWGDLLFGPNDPCE